MIHRPVSLFRPDWINVSAGFLRISLSSSAEHHDLQTKNKSSSVDNPTHAMIEVRNTKILKAFLVFSSHVHIQGQPKAMRSTEFSSARGLQTTPPVGAMLLDVGSMLPPAASQLCRKGCPSSIQSTDTTSDDHARA